MKIFGIYAGVIKLEEGVCCEQCVLLAKPCQPFPWFILYSKTKFACYSRYLLTAYFWITVPYDEKDIFFGGVSSKSSCRSSQNHSTSASSALLFGAQIWITLILNGLPWKQTEIILSFLRLHPSTAFWTVFDYDSYSIFSKGCAHSSRYNGHQS